MASALHVERICCCQAHSVLEGQLLLATGSRHVAVSWMPCSGPCQASVVHGSPDVMEKVGAMATGYYNLRITRFG
ncbi:hypothetical protein ACLOJK_032638 [Asimina triloba]